MTFKGQETHNTQKEASVLCHFTGLLSVVLVVSNLRKEMYVPRGIIDSDHVIQGAMRQSTSPLTSVLTGPYPKQRAEFGSGCKRSYFKSSSIGKQPYMASHRVPYRKQSEKGKT